VSVLKENNLVIQIVLMAKNFQSTKNKDLKKSSLVKAMDNLELDENQKK
jgi:hypothetical protein